MKNGFVNKIIGILIVALVCSCLIALPNNVRASNESVSGDFYKFNKNNDYEVSETSPDKTIDSNASSDFGSFSLSGDVASIDSVDGFQSFEVKSGNVELNYSLLEKYNKADEHDWHTCKDSTKKVDGMKLDSDIKTGAVIVQSSNDGKSWVTDVVYTDVQNPDVNFKSNIFTTNEIQQMNGCYFKILVVYKLEKEIDWSPNDFYRYAEVYQFYIINSTERLADKLSPDTQPLQILASESTKVKNNEGYSEEEAMDLKDPHYSWSLGSFFLNGYSSEKYDSITGNKVFLKSFGDNVVLWFNLKQDINCLNDNEDLIIAEDNGASDSYFQIDKTNFKHGTLIVQFTDFQGVKHDPVVYTDFLAAYANTGADTKIQIFEEGNYEVSLDYKITDEDGIDSHTYYKMSFSFEIRNNNSMVFPFDRTTHDELKDSSITSNGFYVDFAGSHYLTVHVVQYSVTKNNGIYIEDERWSGDIEDGKEFVSSGKYVVTVKSEYADEPIEKVIYVGDTGVLNALAKGNTLDEINSKLSEGYKLNNDGTFEAPIIEEPDPTPTPIPEATATPTPVPTIEPTVATTEAPIVENSSEIEETTIKKLEDEGAGEKEEGAEKESNAGWIVLVIVLVACGAAGYVVYSKKNKQQK